MEGRRRQSKHVACTLVALTVILCIGIGTLSLIVYRNRHRAEQDRIRVEAREKQAEQERRETERRLADEERRKQAEEHAQQEEELRNLDRLHAESIRAARRRPPGEHFVPPSNHSEDANDTVTVVESVPDTPLDTLPRPSQTRNTPAPIEIESLDDLWQLVQHHERSGTSFSLEKWCEKKSVDSLSLIVTGGRSPKHKVAALYLHPDKFESHRVPEEQRPFRLALLKILTEKNSRERSGADKVWNPFHHWFGWGPSHFE
ncbi:RNA helicase [Plasmodiophora brassicae]